MTKNSDSNEITTHIIEGQISFKALSFTSLVNTGGLEASVLLPSGIFSYVKSLYVACCAPSVELLCFLSIKK